MKNVMLTMLTVLGLAMVTSAFASTAHAQTYLNPPAQNAGNNS